MELRDYYTLKEIILGLRDEYRKYNEEIQKLEDLCVVDEERVADFNISTIKHNCGGEEESLPKLHCNYVKKAKLVQLALRRLNWKIFRYDTGTGFANLCHDNNKYYFESHDVDFPIWIQNDKESNDKFFERANAIVYSEFANNIDMHKTFNNYNMTEHGILILRNVPGKFNVASITAYSSWFKIMMSFDESELRNFSLMYNSRTDSLELRVFGGSKKHGYNKYVINEETINNILGIEYPGSELGQYHVRTIDNNSKIEKDVAIECPEIECLVKMDINEEEKQYVLSKSFKN